MLVALIYVGLYVLLSLPSVQNRVRNIACKELSTLFGGKLEIESLSITPFSEVLLNDVSLTSPQGDTCATISKVAAGIDLWCLSMERRIVFNYAEIIGLDAGIEQKVKDGPLNIQFIIDALSPKDKTKPPARFDLRFRNIVVRNSRASFERPWMTDAEGKPMNFSCIELSNLRLDLSIPVLKNDCFGFDIRNMQCDVSPGVNLRGLSADINLKKGDGRNLRDVLSVKNLSIELPGTFVRVGDIVLESGSHAPVHADIQGFVTPSALSGILPQLESFKSQCDLLIDATLSESEIDVAQCEIGYLADGSYMRVSGKASDMKSKDGLDVDIHEFKSKISEALASSILSLFPKINPKVNDILAKAGTIDVDLQGNMQDADKANLTGEISSAIGSIEIEGNIASLKSKKPVIAASLSAEDVELGEILATNKVGRTSFLLDADIVGLDKNAEGEITLSSDYIFLDGRRLSQILCEVVKHGQDVHASIDTDDDDLRLDLDADYHIGGKESVLDAHLNLKRLNTNLLGLKGKFADSNIGLSLDARTLGNNADNITGFLHLSNLQLSKDADKSFTLGRLTLDIDTLGTYDCEKHQAPGRSIRLRSDLMDADISGHLHPATLAAEIKRMVATVFPALVDPSVNYLSDVQPGNDFKFDLDIKAFTDFYDYFGAPVSPLSDIPVKGFIDTDAGRFELSLATPHIRQGRDKLIRDTSLKISFDSFLQMTKVDANTIFPAKKGDVQLAFDISGMHDKLVATLLLNPTFKSSLKGGVTMETYFSKIPNPLTQKQDLSVHVDILPSSVSMKETVWNVARGKIDYHGKTVSVKNFLVEHGNQYVAIDGVASENSSDFLRVKLNDIDLDYIFSILNINYVTFGGMATGEVLGSRLLTKSPVAYTRFLRVKDLSYNGAVLGDGDLASTYFPEEQKVGIYAYIKDPLTRERRANIDGGIWVTRDSLSFTFDANKVNLQFMKPFVSAFCSDLRGIGSGRCKLYGTFSDIDLVGNLRADTVSMKIDFTNTWYHAGNDSVFMGKGLIDIPPLTLYDSQGHTAQLSGKLRHRYFHEPVFDFRIRDAKSILCYDTNEKMNPLWYGTIYGSGSGQIAGRPGLVQIDLNMATEDNSRFFYVISDAEETDEYSFLSFTDKRKEALDSQRPDTMPTYLHQFIKKAQEEEEGSSNVVMSLKGSVTNDALVTLIMDPIAGDKITARGKGALQMDYNMAANDLRMIGTYTLDEGSYYFTLQDIIIKNFVIKPGSNIKFNGDPMNANLDIAATYRVNTNLTDLDPSFSNDKELNRTNVPVDAILLVDGPMTHPDINFDIELPTLTSDVERKVKSIVSTNDMMSRQIIYLLALNRFYTPEYTRDASDGRGSGGAAEMSSMASSTLSSQLSNILSNMTDKLAVAPSFRSDKGDFTDMEFDLALSSRLLNNRLLINGNFGYRDRQTSNTQFVGDFDIEYLLNKNGNLRLKAYNHFNDQSYYLRSALTTQGVGVVYRKDFDHLFNFGKRKQSKSLKNLLIGNKERKDSLSDEAAGKKLKQPESADSIKGERK